MNSMLEYKGYHATVEFDADDEVFVGKVFGIKDSLNFHSMSVDGLKEMFAQTIDNYLALCEKVGKEPEREYKGSFNIRIKPELHRKIALCAEANKMTLNQYVSVTLENSVKSQQIL